MGDADKLLTVTELTAHIKQLLEQNFTHVRLSGEISRLTRAASGHLYFTIKDAHAAISAVIWRSTALRLETRPEEGGEFIFTGHISVYEPRGAYQLVVTRIEPAGAGKLAAEFERRKHLFAERGWFAEEIKKKPPRLPHHIGIVTSPTAAAFEDVRKVLATRPGWLKLTLSPCLVQGNDAPASIKRALERLQKLDSPPDVILLVRGGGSIEDLWCFNDETVVKAVVDCPIPIISGIGHEIDFTLTDFAADVRAATPSNAAELACPSREELRRHLPRLATLAGLLGEQLNRFRQRLNLERQRLHHVWQRQMDARRHRSAHLEQQLRLAGRHRLTQQRRVLHALNRRLKPLEPGVQLSRRRQLLHSLNARLTSTLAAGLRRREKSVMLMWQKLQSACAGQRHQAENRLNQIETRLLAVSAKTTAPGRQAWQWLDHRLHQAAMRHIATCRQRMQRLGGTIHAMDPKRLLQRGYTLSLDDKGRVITHAAQLKKGETMRTHFVDGEVRSQIKAIRLLAEERS